MITKRIQMSLRFWFHSVCKQKTTATKKKNRQKKQAVFWLCAVLRHLMFSCLFFPNESEFSQTCGMSLKRKTCQAGPL